MSLLYLEIIQNNYPKIEIDVNEKDIVQIWMNGKNDSNVIQVERDKIQNLIDILKQEIVNK